MYGHFADECRKPKRNKEQRKEANLAQIEDDEPSLLLAKHEKDNSKFMLLDETNIRRRLMSNDEVMKYDSNLRYLDNGASNHITGQKSRFKELDEGISGHVKFGDGSTVEIKGRGSIILKCKDGQEHVPNEVYFVPSLRNNIISIGQMSEDGYKVTIRGEHVWVYDKEEKLLMKVERSQN